MIAGEIAAFAKDFQRAAGRRLYLTGALMVLLGLFDGIGLLLLVPLLSAAGLAIGTAMQTPAFLAAYLPAQGGLATVVLVYLAVVLGYVTLKLAGVWLNSSLIERYSSDTRIRVHAQLTRLSWRDILQRRGADVAHALTTNVDTLTRGALGLLQFAASAILFLTQLAVALYLSATLTLGALLMLAVAALAGRRLYRKVFAGAQSTVASGKRLHHGAEDFVRRHRHVRAFDNEARSHQEFVTEARGYAHHLREIQWTMGKTQFLTETAAVLLIALTFYLGYTALQIPLASLVVFTVVLARLLPRAMALQREAQVIAAALPARKALTTVLPEANVTPAPPVIPAKAGIQFSPIQTITWQNLSYRIQNLHWHIDHLELKQGQLTALVGPSGIGKSVLCDVLAGLLPPDSGQIILDGVPLVPGASLGSAVRLGYLAQHSRPWQATVGAALRWADPTASDGDCWAALDQAGLAPQIRVRAGLDTPLGDSALWLSGGELHRLALAQVLMRRPQVLILDEPSGALDADTELRLIETMRALTTDRPVLVVTHRESLARAAGQVLTMRESPESSRFVEVSSRA